MKKAFLYLRLTAYVLIPIVLLVLPATYFDAGQPKCLSILLAGTECYGCGMTRGMMHLIHFDFAEAIYHHPLSLLVFPLLAFVWARGFWKDWKQMQRMNSKLTAA